MLALCWTGVDFKHNSVSIPAGFIKRKVCGPLKYGTLPKLILENGTTLHQSESLLRYVGARWKGPGGECLYPPTDQPQQRFWVDVCLARGNAYISKSATAFLAPLYDGYKKYAENSLIWMADDGPLD